MKNKLINTALIQLDVGPDKKANLSKAEHFIREAGRNKADIIALPEMFNWMGPFGKTRESAEDENGPSIKMLKNLAKEYKCIIVGGSILEKNGNKLPFNTTFLFGRRGEILSKYSKMHLFDYETSNYMESEAMTPGKNLAAAKISFGKIGFAICNDLRYPEMFRRLTLAGCVIIFNSSAFTELTGKEHWHSLNRVRAFENQLFIVSTNQSGKNADGVKFYGHSIVVDPWGRIVTEGPPDGDIILYANIDLGKVDEIRKKLPALKKIRRKYIIVSF
jgi:predicted amidohydrolase